MSEIVTVTVNPAIDVATSADHVVAGVKLRCGPSRVDPGGGGINVARTIARFGGATKAIIATGGSTGEQLISMVQDDGVTAIAVPVTGQTRQNLAVTDAHSGAQYRFSLASDPWNSGDTARMINAVKDHTKPDGLVVLSGGLAPGMPVDFHAKVQAELQGITDKLIVDTCDPALSELIIRPRVPLYVLRLDKNEAATAAGHALNEVADSVQFGADLVERGVARIVVIGHGAEGSVLMTRGCHFFCHAATVQVVSKIGAGDAFVGAFTLSLARGDPLDVALQWGVATASATVRTEGTSPCSLQAAAELLPHCRLETFGS